jgi:hypothetical protein
MIKTSRVALVTVALLSGISVAAAAGMSKSDATTNSTASSMSNASAPQAMAKDSLSLTSQQRKTAWQDLSASATKVKAPSGFTARVGAAIPDTLMTKPIPTTTASKVPALRPYQFALLQSNKLLIVNPSDKKVAEVITKS